MVRNTILIVNYKVLILYCSKKLYHFVGGCPTTINYRANEKIRFM